MLYLLAIPECGFSATQPKSETMRGMRFLRTLLCLWAVGVAPACAQEPDAPAVADALPPAMFPHPDGARYFVAGQANIIFQAHAPFHAEYSGKNSLLNRGEYKTSLVATLLMGFEVVRNPRFAMDAIVDEESAGGRGSPRRWDWQDSRT